MDDMRVRKVEKEYIARKNGMKGKRSKEEKVKKIQMTLPT